MLRPPVSSREVDAVALALELQLDAVVDEPLAPQPLADARLDQEVDRALLEHAGADAALDVLAAARLEHDRVDPAQVQKVREHEPGRAGADDADLRPHSSSVASTSRKTRERAVRGGHAAVHRGLEEHLLDLVPRDAVAERGADVHRELVLAAERDEHGRA